ncbi:MAG: NAD-dependent deacylase [SAR324 cluster bacterium]|nr:NAD-dependent deacylase [SAR324 cluster bacterium]
MPEAPQIQAAKEALRQATRILVITGAGISAEAGLPTYRGISGLYNDDKTIEGLHIEEALSGEILKARPEITWKYLLQIEEACRAAKPSKAHLILAELEKAKEVTILTQNIDGFHQRAGSSKVIDIHGNLYDLYCSACGEKFTLASFETLALPPVCTKCGGPVRPDVVFFGEMLSQIKMGELYEEQQKGFDLVLSIGTTSLFPYIAEPVVYAHRLGVTTIEINPEATPVTDFSTFAFQAGATETLEKLIR